MQWKDDRTWLNAGDAVLAICAKAGTTWTMALVASMRERGKANYTSVLDVVPCARVALCVPADAR